jgi:hypothetical protein
MDLIDPAVRALTHDASDDPDRFARTAEQPPGPQPAEALRRHDELVDYPGGLDAHTTRSRGAVRAISSFSSCEDEG